MPNDTIVRAPYNFVPFTTKILEYKDKIPAHNAVDPALKTGEIHVTLTAETPVFVSDGNKDNPHFFRGPDGAIQIPGSTIRGMVRQNMQILGFGLVRLGEDMQDQRVFYRKIADARGSTGGKLKEYYHNALAIESLKSPTGKTYSIPQNVKAGYLRRREDGSYFIQPVTGDYLRVSKKALVSAGLENCYAQTVSVCYTASGDRATAVYRDESGANAQRGILLCPGVDTGGDGTRGTKPKPPSHRYIFPPADESAAPVGISKEDELDYAADWESRKNSLKGGTKINGRQLPYDPDFWKLPKSGEEKPVFYIHCDGHVFFGMSPYLRIGYRFSLKDGLPKSHWEKQENTAFLDWPRAILGWAEKEDSRRSRVSFGDFPAQGDPKEQSLVTTVLGNPKISYYPGYLAEGKHYNQEDFQLRGYKQYWLKDACPTSTDKENAVSRLRPLPVGTRFAGVVRYRNLRPEELGLLLWAIRLEEDCYQSVGMGKPYGYGRMKASIDELREFDLAAMYRPEHLCAAPAAASAGAVQGYIDAYDAVAAKAMYLKKPKKRPSITSTDEIRDFFFLKRTIRPGDEVSYMTLPEYQNVGRPLPATADFRKEAEETVQAAAVVAFASEDNSLEAMKARLAQRFNSK